RRQSINPHDLTRRVLLAARRVSSVLDHSLDTYPREPGVREAGAPDPGDEGRRGEARRDRQSGGDRGSGGVRARGSPSEPEAEQGARRDALHVQGLSVADPAPNEPPGLTDPFGEVRYRHWDGTQPRHAAGA